MGVSAGASAAPRGGKERGNVGERPRDLGKGEPSGPRREGRRDRRGAPGRRSRAPPRRAPRARCPPRRSSSRHAPGRLPAAARELYDAQPTCGEHGAVAPRTTCESCRGEARVEAARHLRGGQRRAGVHELEGERADSPRALVVLVTLMRPATTPPSALGRGGSVPLALKLGTSASFLTNTKDMTYTLELYARRRICLERLCKRISSMAMTHDYLDYLNQRVGIAPANSQEELQGRPDHRGLMSHHDVEPSIEEFDAPSLSASFRRFSRCSCSWESRLRARGRRARDRWPRARADPDASRRPAPARPCTVPLLGPARAQPERRGSPRASGPLVAKGNRPIVVVAHYDTRGRTSSTRPPSRRTSPSS